MTHITFYEKPGCGGNAKQKTMLVAAGHTLEVRDLLKWRWTPTTLLAFLQPLPVPEWFNRAAPDIRSGRLIPESFDAGSALALLLAQPLLIRRPLMQAGETRMVGFEIQRVHAWVGLGHEAAARHAPRSLEGCAAAADGCSVTSR